MAQQTETQTDETGKVVVTSTTSDRTTEPEAPVVKEGDVKSLPQWAQDIISGVRAEAANYRTKLRETETTLSKAKTPEDIEAATQGLKETNARLERELLVTKVAAKHKLPADLADALKGDDEKALEEHATRLAKFVVAQEPEKVEPESLSGGLDPSGKDSDGFDPVAEAKRARATRY